MPKAAYLFIVSMDVAPEKEDLFNEVYDKEHIPNLLRVPGVLSARRSRTEVGAVKIGGEEKPVTGEGRPRYSAVYEIVSPEVLRSDAWAEAVEEGRWPDEVRPFTSNRDHILRKII